MFVLGRKSLARLRGVHPDLVRVLERAIELTEIDFTVVEGLRSEARQRELYLSGASKTLDSRHLTGHAVDLGALVGGTLRWDWGLYIKIAEAMQLASRELNIPVRWGGAWVLLHEVGDLGTAIADYVGQCQVKHRKPLLDGPHFELPRPFYL